MKLAVLRSSLLLSLGAGIALSGCVEATIEGETSTLDDEETRTFRRGTPRLTMIDLGASTTFGVAFHVGALGPEEYVAGNHHIPALAAYLEDQTGARVDVVNLAIGGKRSDQILAEQLPVALDTLADNRKRSGVTIEAGGNDLLQYLGSPDGQVCYSPAPEDQYACAAGAEAVLDAVEANIEEMILALRATDRRVPIFLQTQYNPLRGSRFDGQPCADATTIAVADAALEGNPAVPAGGPLAEGLNTRIRRLASEHGAFVADIAGFLYSTGQAANDDMFSADCTHLSGVWDGLPAYGIAGDSVGKGYAALFGVYVDSVQFD